MDIQKEREAYLGELLEREVITQDEFRDLVFKPEVNAFDSNYLSSRFIDKINFGWSVWQAKAQAVPEGYVLMPIKPTKTMVMVVAKEHEGDAFLPYSLYDAYVKQAMIEAQEKNQ